MHIFVTGGSGFVGSAVIAELLRSGHKVTALARSAESAEKIVLMGAKAHRGDLEDLDRLRSGAEMSDGVIHCGFIHDFTKYKENCEIDRRAIEALGEGLAGKKRPLVVTSGLGLNVSGRFANEDDMPPPSSQSPRAASEEAARAAAEIHKFPVAVIRLAPSVHGTGDHGFVPLLISLAGERKFSAYVGEVGNRWCAVHRYDAAVLYRLAFEKLVQTKDKQSISYYHGVAEPEIPFRSIAEVIGKRLNLPVKNITSEEAATHFAWFAHFAQIDITASSEKTRNELGWQPTEIGLLDDLDRPEYFEN
jgi:nucleoside-diphosphate-sugar epimerase